MTTTTSTTGGTSTVASIVSTLGSGSGIDTASLVEKLVDASFSYKNQTLKAKDDALTTQISAVGNLQSGITSFASGLASLINGGSLSTQASSGDTGIVKASNIAGTSIAGLPAAVEVTQLAAAQSAVSTASFAGRTATVGTGTLTLTFGTATVADGAMTAFTAGSATPVSITIDASNNTLDGIAKAINAANAGVTASVITDADGTARLAVKGPTGAANAFTLSGDSPELAQFNIGVGETATTIGQAAQNAKLKLDGIAVERASNSVSDLITGVKLDLVSAGIGKPVTISASSATDGLTQVVNNFVETYNQFQAILAPAIASKDGVLKNDSAAQTLSRSLARLTSTTLVSGAAAGVPTTLAEIGVGTNRDGTLKVDTTVLAKAIAANPTAVEALFTVGTGASGAGLGGALNAIATAASDRSYGLAASTTNYTNRQADIQDAEAKATDDAAAMRTRLTQQFASMDARVAAYKSTQTFLQGQIDAWNKKS